MQTKLDPRIEPMFRGRPPHEQFLAAAMCAILSAAKLLDQVIDDVVTKDIDWNEVVAGKAMIHWNGKSRQQLEREKLTPKQIKDVHDALKRRGIKLPDQPKAPEPQPVAEPAPQPQPDPVKVAPADNATKAPVEVAADGVDAELVLDDGDVAASAEPTFAGRKLSELAPLSDSELLKIEGVSRATIKQIREAAKQAK